MTRMKARYAGSWNVFSLAVHICGLSLRRIADRVEQKTSPYVADFAYRGTFYGVVLKKCALPVFWRGGVPSRTKSRLWRLRFVYACGHSGSQ